MWKTHPLFTDYQANELGDIRCLNYGNIDGNIRPVKQTKRVEGYLFFQRERKTTAFPSVRLGMF
jgi:hypothetical protein